MPAMNYEVRVSDGRSSSLQLASSEPPAQVPTLIPITLELLGQIGRIMSQIDDCKRALAFSNEQILEFLSSMAICGIKITPDLLDVRRQVHERKQDLIVKLAGMGFEYR